MCYIVSVLPQNKVDIGNSIPDTQEISRDPGDFPWANIEENLEDRGDGFPNISRVLVEYGHSSHHQSIYILQGWIRKSIPVGREGLTV